jgi:hypothetical protein
MDLLVSSVFTMTYFTLPDRLAVLYYRPASEWERKSCLAASESRRFTPLIRRDYFFSRPRRARDPVPLGSEHGTPAGAKAALPQGNND